MLSKTELQEKLQACLQTVINLGVPSLSASISNSTGSIWSCTAGFSSLPSQTQSSGTPLKPTHLLPIGSITKPFISTIIYQLVESSQLSLTSTISSILDKAVYEGIPNASSATIAMLLSHTSGIESWEDNPAWIRDARGENIDVNKIWGKPEPLEYIRHERKPGEKPHPGVFGYANTNFTFLGLIIEKLTGNDVVEEIRRRILQPCGMDLTMLEGFEEIGARQVAGRYHWATDDFKRDAGLSPYFRPVISDERLVDVSATNLSTEWAAGGIVSTTTDLSSFLVALRDGKLISKDSLDEMMEWRAADEDDENEKVGGGLFRWRKEEGGEWWVGHFGGVLGGGGVLLWKEREEGGIEGEGDCVISILSACGSMHAGTVPGSSGKVITRTEFLDLALELCMSAAANSDISAG